MDNSELQVYLSCSIVTTLAFIYLIYNFVLCTQKKSSFDSFSAEELQSLNQNIAGVITNFSLVQTHQQQIRSDSTLLTSTAKKIIHSRKERNLSKENYRRQCLFLPYSERGLLEMKALNKRFIKNNQKAEGLGLIKQKKKKNLSNYVKKYGFHKTALVTIYEQLQY